MSNSNGVLPLPKTNIGFQLISNNGWSPSPSTNLLSNSYQRQAFVNNLRLLREQVFKRLIDPRRDIDGECGYPVVLAIDDYRLLYEREGVARRAVALLPEECFAMDPDVFEDESEDVETPFEVKLKEYQDQFNLWAVCQTIDEISGIGQYGVILIGVNDGKNLDQPVRKGIQAKDEEPDKEREALFFRCFDQKLVNITQWDSDPKSPRYGQPLMYDVTVVDIANDPPIGSGTSAPPMTTLKVHWSRIVHVADNVKSNPWLGIPRMKPIFNRLADLRKTMGASGEMFWRGAIPGLSIEALPQAIEAGIELDTDTIKEEVGSYSNSLQRYMAFVGMTAKSLAPQVSDPTQHVMIHLQAIAIHFGCPLRKFMGSEQAQLASGQDDIVWNKRVHRRREKHCGPNIIRALLDRLIWLGCLPKPKEYTIDWPDLNSPGDKDKAAILAQRVSAVATYITSGVEQLIPPIEFLTKEMGYTKEEAEAIIEAGQEHQIEQADIQEEEFARQQELLGAYGADIESQQQQEQDRFGQEMDIKKMQAKKKPVGNAWTDEARRAAEEAKRRKRLAHFPESEEDVTLVKRLGGSTGAELVKTVDGHLFVRKRGNSKGHILEEYQALQAYRTLGVRVPEAIIYGEHSANPTMLTELIDGVPLGSYLRTADPAKQKTLLNRIASGFVVDAVLGNWDVAGLELDNIIVTPDGDPVRVDVGGSLRYRAQGAMKSLSAFGESVSEIKSLRDAKVNRTSAKVFGTVSDNDIKAQILNVHAKKDKLTAVLEPEVSRRVLARINSLYQGVVRDQTVNALWALDQSRHDLTANQKYTVKTRSGAGFTGMIVDSLGRKYYFVDGKKVPASEKPKFQAKPKSSVDAEIKFAAAKVGQSIWDKLHEEDLLPDSDNWDGAAAAKYTDTVQSRKLKQGIAEWLDNKKKEWLKADQAHHKADVDAPAQADQIFKSLQAKDPEWKISDVDVHKYVKKNVDGGEDFAKDVSEIIFKKIEGDKLLNDTAALIHKSGMSVADAKSSLSGWTPEQEKQILDKVAKMKVTGAEVKSKTPSPTAQFLYEMAHLEGIKNSVKFGTFVKSWMQDVGMSPEDTKKVLIEAAVIWANEGPPTKASLTAIESYAAKNKFTGTLTDSLGRKYTFVDGKRVKGAGEVGQYSTKHANQIVTEFLQEISGNGEDDMMDNFDDSKFEAKLLGTPVDFQIKAWRALEVELGDGAQGIQEKIKTLKAGLPLPTPKAPTPAPVAGLSDDFASTQNLVSTYAKNKESAIAALEGLPNQHKTALTYKVSSLPMETNSKLRKELQAAIVPGPQSSLWAVEKVDLSKVKLIYGKAVVKKQVLEYLKNVNTAYSGSTPVFIKSNDTYYLISGSHKILADQLMGISTRLARVFDIKDKDKLAGEGGMLAADMARIYEFELPKLKKKLGVGTGKKAEPQMMDQPTVYVTPPVNVTFFKPELQSKVVSDAPNADGVVDMQIGNHKHDVHYTIAQGKIVHSDEMYSWTKAYYGNLEKLNSVETNAINGYTNGEYHVNGDLYKHKDKWSPAKASKSEIRTVKHMDSAFVKYAGQVPEDIIVFRSVTGGVQQFIDQDVGLEVGKVFKTYGFVSTSFSTSRSGSWSDSFEILIPKGSTVLPANLSKFSHPSEQEVILPRGAEFDVLAKRKKGDKVCYTLRLRPTQQLPVPSVKQAATE